MGDNLIDLLTFSSWKRLQRCDLAELKFQKIKKHHCHIALLWGSAAVSFLTWEKQEKEPEMRTPLLMQFKKQKKTDKKWNDIKKISTSGGGGQQ